MDLLKSAIGLQNSSRSEMGKQALKKSAVAVQQFGGRRTVIWQK